VTRPIGAVIAGVQKSGTTTLAAMLAAHPGVVLARAKEAHLFDRAEVQRDGVPDGLLDARFGPDDGRLRLDATPAYLYLPGCLEALVRHAPEVRVIVLVREPAARALSHYRHERRFRTERLPFPAALAAEPVRLRRDRDPLAIGSAHRVASYLDRSDLLPQIARLRRLVRHVHVVPFPRLVADPAGTLAQAQLFLGLPPLPWEGPAPFLNADPDPRPSVLLPVLRALLAGRTRRIEEALGWPRGTLRDPVR